MRDDVRLVRYDSFKKIIADSLDGKQNFAIGQMFFVYKSNYHADLLLEQKRPDLKFRSYKSGGL